MDPFSKKRKPDENGAVAASPAAGAAALGLTRDDVLRLLDPLSRDQLADIAAVIHSQGLQHHISQSDTLAGKGPILLPLASHCSQLT